MPNQEKAGTQAQVALAATGVRPAAGRKKWTDTLSPTMAAACRGCAETMERWDRGTQPACGRAQKTPHGLMSSPVLLPYPSPRAFLHRQPTISATRSFSGRYKRHSSLNAMPTLFDIPPELLRAIIDSVANGIKPTSGSSMKRFTSTRIKKQYLQHSVCSHPMLRIQLKIVDR